MSSRRGVARFAAAVAMVSGVLLIVEAGLTVLWQEPISALLASRSQDELEDDFERERDELQATLAALTPGSRAARTAPTIAELAAREARNSEVGEALGKIEIPALDASFAFVQGADEGSLRKGPGHYVQTELPGQGGTVAIAGHRTTYLAPFRDIDQLEPGDSIKLEMPYGTFRYDVARVSIVDPSEIWVLGDVDHERLVLSACHPLYSAAQRIVVFATPVSGPDEV